MDEGSITRWIPLLRAGETEAANQLWDRFFGRMKMLAKVQSKPAVTKGAYDEEDVALSAFAGFCRAVSTGNYPELHDRSELWQVLATYTYRKARERALAADALKRGGSADAGEPRRIANARFSLEQVEGQTLPPDIDAMMNEQCAHLFGMLKDPELENVAAWKLEGYTNDEIAERLGYTRRTIQRMLALIRRIWKNASEY
jgi:hypothetical protein